MADAPVAWCTAHVCILDLIRSILIPAANRRGAAAAQGDETQVTAVVNLQKLMDVPGMAKFFQRKFSAGLSACMEEDKHSGDIPGCGAFKHCVVGLPEPLQKILDGFLAPLSLLNLV